MSGDSIMSLDRRKQKGGERSERGSALLIVFVFAAIVAIMLYKEMPVSAFEARRQKEELLIDRGNEYKHAIKIYVRKIGSFPPSMEALENTNRMRFLRHKFDDPITGKNDWRILHAGPNGMIVDSKIPGANGAMGKTAASAGNTTLISQRMVLARASGVSTDSSFSISSPKAISGRASRCLTPRRDWPRPTA